MMGVAYRASRQFLKHYSNTHSLLHFSAKVSTKTYNWIHDKILDFVGADSEEFTCFFMGSGVTSGMNKIAKTIKTVCSLSCSEPTCRKPHSPPQYYVKQYR